MNANGRVISVNVLNEQIAAAQRRLNALNHKILELANERSAIEGEIRGLKALADLAVDSSTTSTNLAKLKPKAAILGYLRAHPGVISSTVVGALEGEVETQATDVRRNLHSTLYNMRNRGLVEERRGKLYAVDESEGGDAP